MAVDSRTQSYIEKNPGPYEAVIVSHLDPKFNGMLEVELLKATASGNLSERTGQIVQVSYLNPFYGVTPYKDMTANDGYANTQQSYGMWFIPPDIGTRVLVIFAEGNAANGFWIGCVPDDYMNHMIPGIAATTFNSKDKSKPVPVAEYNKRVEKATKNNPTKYIKPDHEEVVKYLEEQGLVDDGTRGYTSSSARREVPSSVFGISTPGPADRRPGSPKGRYGTQGAKANVPASRLGGTTFVMDDGDSTLLRKKSAAEDKPEYVNVEKNEKGGDPTLIHNEHVRIRTRTGHQILLHNTEDLIYIGNAKGTTWIELTANGKIDIYAKDSISVHTENDINLKADRDITMQAGRNISIGAANEIRIESGANYNLKVGAAGKIQTTGNIDIKSGGDTKITSTGTSHVNSGGNHVETASNIYMNGGVTAESASDAETAFFPYRVPQKEPWLQHENLNPKGFTPEYTDNTQDKNIPENAEYPVIPDTFKQET